TEVISTEQRVEHTTQVLDRLDDLFPSFVDLNFAWSGRHLTRDKGLIPPLSEFKGSISSQSEKIRALTADNAEQQQRIALLRSTTEGMFKFIEEAGNVQPASGDGSADATIGPQWAKERLEEVQTVLRQMKLAEQKLCTTRLG